MGDLTTPCLSTVLDPLDQYAVGAYSNGEIKVFDPHGGGLLKTLTEDYETTGKPINTVLKFKPANDSAEQETILLVGDNDGNITKYDVTDGMEIEKIEGDTENVNKIYALDYSSNGRQFAAAGYDGMVRVYDDITMKMVQDLDPYKSGHAGHSNRVFSVKFNKDDPNILISGGWDNNIIIHDMREKGPVNAIIGAYVCGEALDFSGNTILSGSSRMDKQIQLWDLETTKLLKNVDWKGNGHFKDMENCRVFCAKFLTHTDTGKEYILAGGGVSNEIRIFNEEHEPIIKIGDYSRGTFSCDASATGDSVISGGGDGVLRLFRVMFGID
jgi:WD40 repeat protein